MVNPLARVVMENIVKKSKNAENTVKNGYRDKTWNKESKRGNLTDLDSLADKLRGVGSEIPRNNKDQDKKLEKPSKNIDFKTDNKNNLSFDELKLLAGAIKGDVKVESRSSASNKKNNTLSLDRLAEIVKNKD